MGLECAVVGLCEEVSNRHGVTIDVHRENIRAALPPEVSLCLYRVLQEALQNVVKHSLSTRPRRAERSSQRNMKERLKVLGGHLSIHSERGRGTMIHAVAPLCPPTKPANAA